MFFRYDFHNHSCLSPCGDNDMTPCNIVGMAKILNLDIIALTDHNSCLNCSAAVKLGENSGVTVIPGMELCTAEEIHVVCLLPNTQKALDFSAYVRERIPPVKNREEIFGEQLILSEDDEIIGKEDLLLTTASSIGIYEVPSLIKSFGGAAFPAHINRSSYSVISSLGEITADMGFSCAELTRDANLKEYTERFPDLSGMNIFYNSDAHYLENMNLDPKHIELEEPTAEAVIEYINSPR